MDYVNPKGKTLQELFDVSVYHVLKQGEPSMDDNGDCLYNGPNGLHCGAAMFLTEEEIIECEGSSICASLGWKLDEESLYFIQDLQDCHDESADYMSCFVEVYRDKAKNLAKFHNLNTEVLGE